MTLRRLTALAPVLALALAAAGCDWNRAARDDGQTAAAPAAAEAPARDDWWAIGQYEVAQRLAAQRRDGQARNVILFVVDGMGVSTVTAARIFEGQQRGEGGEENYLAFERFPYAALVKTYTHDAQTADSAATASALNTGVKTNFRAVSTFPGQTIADCGPDGRPFPRTLAQRAEDRGMATGIVTTTSVTHATPAAVYAHAMLRYWQSDANMPAEALEAGCRDIARQLVEFNGGRGLDVALGGGTIHFTPEDAGGRRRDGADLTAQWREGPRGGVYVTNAAGLRALDPRQGPPVLGLFAEDHMAYEHDRDDAEEPSLAEMTRFAIQRLSRNENGYYLMVEAGRVDMAHHATNAWRALTDMAALNEAVLAALELADLDDTLIIVTADHSHVFNISGYSIRGNPIHGLARAPHPQNPAGPVFPMPARDGRPYTTLGYYAGPVLRPRDGEPLTQEQVTDPDYRQEAAIPMGAEPHGGEDVPLYADGPRAHLFTGVMEQNTVFHLIAHALGWDLSGEE